MTITCKTSTHPSRPAWLASPRVLMTAVLAVLRSVRNRRAVLRVSDMPDELLNDIGLRRDDVYEALQTNWREDPSYQLALAASRRRRCL